MEVGSKLVLYLFGAPRIKRAEVELHLSRRKAVALLTYLAVTRRQFSRDTLATLLWPEHDDSHARGSLRRMLSELKSQLGGDYLSTEEQLVRLSDPESIRVDVNEFERLIARSRAHKHEKEHMCPECRNLLVRAAELYVDDFMIGFSLKECSEFSDWQFLQGEYYLRELSTALEKLTEICLATEARPEGIRYARRWVAVDPLSEEGHRALMQLYALEGQQAAALRQYQLCRDQLESELGIAPEEKTDELFTAIKGRRFTAAQPGKDTGAVMAPRLVVLPLKDLASMEDEDWLADGMTDALITELSHIAGLQVISFTSCMRYKETAKSLQQIAADLKVNHVLEGAVVRAGNQIRVSAQLIDVATDSHIWADSLQSPFENILSLQSEMAHAIAGKIEKRLVPQVTTGALKIVIPRAHEELMVGDFYLRRRGSTNVWKAIEHYKKAIDIDPLYAPAHSGLAEAYTHLWGYGGCEDIPLHEAREKAFTAVQTALEIDPNLVRARSALGSIKWRFDWDWKGALEDYEKALEINPEHSETLQGVAHITFFRGRFEEAIERYVKVDKLDPLHPVTTQNLAVVYMFTGYYHRALLLLEKNEELFPQIEQIYSCKMYIYLKTNQPERALQEGKKIAIKRVETPMVLGYLGLFYSWCGMNDTAQQILERMLLLREKGRIVPAVYVALVYNGLGKTEETLQWLERAYEEHDSYLPVIAHFPEWEALRADPRCQDLIRRIGIDN
ncbi:MAG: hypothetical protein JSV89_21985 [Spirochaetaceae bacterium]|nr:MAG: hypothetical protein JSV89_21985 [Spirochaetaceae bacterium]